LRTYLDTCVLIAAFNGDDSAHAAAVALIDDPEREFVSSLYLHLELLPQPAFYGHQAQLAWFTEWLANADCIQPSTEIARNAIDLASRYCLGAVDALHISSAAAAQVAEFVTAEAPTKPMLKVREISVRTIRA
jgi:predicted nucleic acid-binding protein